MKCHFGMCLYLIIPSMSKEIFGIKVLFKATTDFVSLFRLQGQLGLGEDRIHVCTPCLLSSSQLAEVTQIQAGDSYSAAITGESIIQPLRAIHTKNYKDTYSLTHRKNKPKIILGLGYCHTDKFKHLPARRISLKVSDGTVSHGYNLRAWL